ncbi:cytochrome P450 hydroxylase [Streptomyces hygroscopicus subsp. jinggangensis 5008]|nr:cytochrome P450 hydroxylase [Streptomyces hygroscopicus subsp. jinggangensis 5008]
MLGHAELKAFLADPDVAKDPHHFAALQRGEIPEGWPLTLFCSVEGMANRDGSDHRRLRRLVGEAFTPGRVAALRPRITKLTEKLLDQVGAAASTSGEGIVDVRQQLSVPLPLEVIGELMGIPQEHRDPLHDLSVRIVATQAEPAETLTANLEMATLMATVVAAKAQQPGDDLISALLAARDGDDRLTQEELIGTLIVLIVAGHDTTTHLVTNAIRALCTHREQLALVRSGQASWEDVVEETLRWDAPVSYFPFRYPVKDITVGGTELPAGTPVLAAYSAAGRDRRAFGPDADRFDVTRSRRPGAARHISFGHGPHFCLGAPLARLEASVALERLFARWPDLDIVASNDELGRYPTFVGNSVLHLPVRLTP